MKIAYIVNLRLPTEKAHGYQIAKMLEAWAELGCEVELIHPQRNNKIKQVFFNFYGLQNEFPLRLIKSFDWFSWSWLPSWIGNYLNSISFLIKLVSLKLDKQTIIISRNPEIVWLFNRRGFKTVYDAHRWPERFSPVLKWLLKGKTKAVANSFGTGEEAKRYGLKSILVAPNGVDLDEFNQVLASPKDLRQKLDLPLDKIIVTYTGHLYAWKGVRALLEAFKSLSSDNIFGLIVGGKEPELSDLKNKYGEIPNLKFIGQVSHSLVPAYLLAADILVLPTAPISVEAERYTSPIKLFEYLAAGKPIVVSDLPSLREIVDDHSAVLFRAGDSIDLAQKLKALIEDENWRLELGERAKHLAEQYTWQSRADKIMKFIS